MNIVGNRLGLCICLWALNGVVQAAGDPYDSPQWSVMQQRYLGPQKVLFDDAKIKVFAPKHAEDSLRVPVFFRIEGLDEIEEIVVFADLNPLPLVLKFYPQGIQPNLAFRLKLQQSSPIRVAARTSEQIWHVGSAWVDAAGGGCTTPSVGAASGDWYADLGKVHVRLWRRDPTQGGNRLRMKILHPMDTGLAEGIPAFYIESLNLLNADEPDQPMVGRLALYEPVSENPTLSFDIGAYQQIALQGRDNNGNRIQASIQ